LLRTAYHEQRRQLLGSTVAAVVEAGALQLEACDACTPDELAASVAEIIIDKPVLVVSVESPKRLLGIITAFDLLDLRRNGVPLVASAY
jgi:hypothetical protein